MKSQNKAKSLLLILFAALVTAISNPVLGDQETLNPDGQTVVTLGLSFDSGSVPPALRNNWGVCTLDDGDTSYVFMNGTWNYDLYQMSDVSLSGSINWVSVYIKAKAEDAEVLQEGARTAISTEGGLYYGTEILLTANYTEYYTEYTLNPTTGVAWTWDEINALQAGVSLRRSNETGRPNSSLCTLVYVVVDYTPSDYEGLSHGYWKNHPDDWPATGYSPDQTLGSVFTESSSFGLDGYTLLEALNFPGGETPTEKAQILLRNAVASLLNAAHPNINYPLTEADVISQVNAALASGDVDTMLDLEAILDGYNNLGGDLSS